MLDKKLRRYALIALLIALALGVWGEISRVLARAALSRETAETATPTVATVTAQPSTAAEDLVLPGAVQAYIEAPIYARTSGYLKSWRTDIGTPVVKGQLLAEIDTPEVDQQ
jgi:multidrug efflux pump subunit AcrA (membrane-fusion protein)